MKVKRAFLFRALTVLLLIAIGGVMLIIGRGHTVYIDNKSIEYNGQTYEGPYKAVVFVDGEQVAKLYDKERGMAACMGQRFDMTLEITQKKGGDEATQSISLRLPYNMDGVVINLPALLQGLPEEAYLSEFVSMLEEEPADEEIVTDEFALPEEEPVA